jgi:dihydroorotase-like cyclic amidohydrolase
MAKDWTQIQKKYKGLWVALADDEVTVLASGKTLHETQQKAQKKGYNDPIFTRMPEKVVTYAGLF